MSFFNAENIKMIVETARDFAEKNIRPYVMEWDEKQIFPKELFHKLGEMGFMGIGISRICCNFGRNLSNRPFHWAFRSSAQLIMYQSYI